MMTTQIYYVNKAGDLFKINDLEILQYEVDINVVEINLRCTNGHSYKIERIVCSNDDDCRKVGEQFIAYIYSSIERIYNVEKENKQIEILTSLDFLNIKGVTDLIGY